jgi:hypothetical protein
MLTSIVEQGIGIDSWYLEPTVWRLRLSSPAMHVAAGEPPLGIVALFTCKGTVGEFVERRCRTQVRGLLMSIPAPACATPVLRPPR